MDGEFLCKLLKIGKNEIKKQVNYLNVCYVALLVQNKTESGNI